MKLQRIEIHETRGVHHVVLAPEGKSVVILGPNGCGKSSIADALDFLLTGRISRLTGEGSEGIALREVGPHIEANRRNAWVEGTFSLHEGGHTVKLTRRFSQPNKLESDEPPDEALQRYLAGASRGLHLLTRRELLRFVIARAQTRAERVGALLDLEEVEATRRAIVRVSGGLDRKAKDALQLQGAVETRISTVVGLPAFSETASLERVNRLLAVLGARAISRLTTMELKSAILAASPQPSVTGPTRNDVARNLQIFKESQEPAKIQELRGYEASLRETLSSLKENPDLLRQSMTLDVVRASLPLLDESGRCPVCDTLWDPAELLSHLTKKLADVEAASPALINVQSMARTIHERVDVILSAIDEVKTQCVGDEFRDDLAVLELWKERLKLLRQCLESPLSKYPDARFSGEAVSSLLWNSHVAGTVDHLFSQLLPRMPVVTPKEDARAQLGKLETLVEQLQDARRATSELEKAAELSTVLRTSFEGARDSTLEGLYLEVANQFLSYYQELHPDDAQGISATLRASGAGLDLGVGYQGRGPFPPQAVHSEGHQDSMGLCLFLALSERLLQGALEMVILDDVMTSIDAEHRRAVALLLKRLSEDKQFIVLTHDSVWARQLKTVGLVSEKRIWRITGWSFLGGPLVADEGDWWGDIRRSLDADNVPAAAASLRRNLEYLFGEACESLRAKVRFRAEATHDFGELYEAFLERANELFSKAKDQANSVGDRGLVKALSTRHDLFRRASQQISAEQWVINLSVHFNRFADLRPNEVRPALQAFEGLFEQVTCPTCHGILAVIPQDHFDAVVMCPCHAQSWPLPARKDGHVSSPPTPNPGSQPSTTTNSQAS